MKVGELCKRLSVPYRHVRYVLEEGILPEGVVAEPGRGEHRDLDFAQSFWMAVVLMLKRNGLKTALAGRIADYTERGVRGISVNLAYESTFNPSRGRYDTEFQWYADIGDLAYIRMATTANPSGGGRLEEHPWTEIETGGLAKDATPVVIIRLDINRLVAMLRD